MTIPSSTIIPFNTAAKTPRFGADSDPKNPPVSDAPADEFQAKEDAAQTGDVDAEEPGAAGYPEGLLGLYQKVRDGIYYKAGQLQGWVPKPDDADDKK